MLKIAEITIGTEGFRIIKEQKVQLPTDGIIKVNGKSGAGKSTLQEIIKIAIAGGKAKRDGQNEEMDYKVKIHNTLDGTNFYIRVKTKTNGAITYSFLFEDNNNQGVTKNMTVSQLQKMLTTELTFNINEMLSESETIQTKWILRAFADTLENSGISEIEKDLETAIKQRDIEYYEKSKLGAFLQHIEENNIDIDTPTKIINLDALINKRTDIETTIEKCKNEINAINISNSQRKSEIDSKLVVLWGKIETYNATIEEKYINTKNRIDAENAKNEAEHNKKHNAIQNILKLSEDISIEFTNEIKPLILKHTPEASKKIETPTKPKQIDKNELLTIDISTIENEIANYILQIRKEIQLKKSLNFEVLSTVLSDLTEKQSPAEKEKELMKLNNDLNSIILDMKLAKEKNEMSDKIDIWKQWKIADNAVKSLNVKKSNIYKKIKTGVEGLKIRQMNEDSKNLTLTYSGDKDTNYFKNLNKEDRPVTSYSKGQQHFIATMLHLEFLKKQANPLNVIFFDDLGIDNKLTMLFDEFAKENNLVIFIPQTNDKNITEIGNNEILIQDGQILFNQ